MRKLTTITILTLLALSFFLAKPLFAAVRCETQYGGGEVCVKTGQLQINKKVFDSDSNQFVDNLGINTRKFTSGDEITFRLEIKNVGDATFDKVSVNDTLPSFLEITSGSLSFDITDLTPGETETREIKAKVVGDDKLPSDKNIVCVVNTAEVSSGDERDKDTAQVCLEKKVLGITTFPKVGPENSFLIIFGSLVFGVLGLSLLKFSKKSLG